jgi:acyl carrier protein
MSAGPSIAASVVTAIADAFELDEAHLAPGTRLYDDLGVDSLTFMELLCALEEDLAIALPESTEFALGLRTIGDVIDAFEAYAGRSA